MLRFTDRMLPEIVQPFWAALQRGEFIVDAAAQVGTYRKKGSRWVAAHGGVRPRRRRNLKGRCLTFGEREEIALARARGESLRTIAQRLGRAPSTISRELRRNRDQCGYRATTAHALAYGRASRPKPAKLASNLALRAKVEQDLTRRYSPEQIAGRFRVEFPDQPEMWVSTETIYQSLYVQSRGALRRELTRCGAYGPFVASSRPNAGTAQEPHPRHGEHRRAPTRSGRAGGAGALGGRLAGRPAQRQRHRHPGGAGHRVHDAGVPTRRLQARAGGTSAGRQDGQLARDAAPLAHLGPGRRDA